MLVKELPFITLSDVIKVLEMDFLDTNPKEKDISQEDFQFLQLLTDKIWYNDGGHLEIPLLSRASPHLSKNRYLAEV